MIIIGNKKNGDVGEYIGRPSVLGNPFVMNSEKDRQSVIDKYEIWLRKELQGNNEVKKEILRLKEKYKMNGVLVLVCWCYPKKCHGDIIKKAILEWDF